MTVHKADGFRVFVLDWDRRVASGWSFNVKEGDEVQVEMKSGKIGRLRVKKIRRMMDPRDQYFADLEDIGYLNEENK